MRQHAMYLPWRGAHLAIMAAGAYEESMKWILGYGTKLVWNSVMSTFKAPSKRSDAVSEEITCARRRLRFVYVGRSISRLRRQISYRASLSTWLVTSVCSRSECTHKTVLYGSTHAEEICGHDQTVNEIFDFLP